MNLYEAIKGRRHYLPEQKATSFLRLQAFSGAFFGTRPAFFMIFQPFFAGHDGVWGWEGEALHV